MGRIVRGCFGSLFKGAGWFPRVLHVPIERHSDIIARKRKCMSKISCDRSQNVFSRHLPNKADWYLYAGKHSFPRACQLGSLKPPLLGKLTFMLQIFRKDATGGP
jgi:hypothetical protein